MKDLDSPVHVSTYVHVCSRSDDVNPALKESWIVRYLLLIPRQAELNEECRKGVVRTELDVSAYMCVQGVVTVIDTLHMAATGKCTS